MSQISAKKINSPKIARGICFCSPPYQEFAKRTLPEEFPGLSFEMKSGSLLRQEGLWRFIRAFRTFDKAVYFTYDLDMMGMLFLGRLALLWLSKRGAYLLDMQGKRAGVKYGPLFWRYLPTYFMELVSIPRLLLQVRQHLRRFFSENTALASEKAHLGDALKIVYLRTQLWFGIKSGGSVTHTAGVAEGFLSLGHFPFFISTDKLELIDTRQIPVYIIKAKGLFRDFPELPEMEYSSYLAKSAKEIFDCERPALIYQRYSLNNYSGVLLATQYHLPLILEYNGSEVWVARHWDRPLRHEKLANEIELFNLRAADLIVVVSKPMQEELTARGIPEGKILINPNGVNPERYRPDIGGSKVRQHYGLGGKVVVGFIGTFGQWHGAEVLAKAAVAIVNKLNMPEPVHFLFIGDGVRLSETKRIVREGGIENKVTFTGLVAQEEGAEYLAACDILVSPHVPNLDGTPFFGSPTKLFEYMAMGRGIVASNLGQIGEVLEHGKTAWLVEAGNVDELAEGITTLVKKKKLREFLGQNARNEVLAKHTWEQHVSRTLAKLREILE